MNDTEANKPEKLTVYEFLTALAKVLVVVGIVLVDAAIIFSAYTDKNVSFLGATGITGAVLVINAGIAGFVASEINYANSY